MASGDDAGSWWADEPLRRPDDDRLQRIPFAARVVQVLDWVSQRPSSTVVGIVGAWGSGKSTTLNFVIGGLDADLWSVKAINPWALGAPHVVIEEILAAIVSSMPPGPKGEKARALIRDYAGLAVPFLSSVPIVGNVMGGLTQELMKRLQAGDTFDSRMQKLGEALQEVERPVLVVIDDVDRLQPDELLNLFKAVRVLGRLPYVHYMLAYDEQTLLDVLKSTAIAQGRDDRAVAFLEKIVTLRLDQPPTRPEQAATLFANELAEALSFASVLLSDEQQLRLGYERELLLSRGLREPRAIARFMAQLRAYLPLVGPEEVDVVDFVVMTYLRLMHPRLYRVLDAEQSAISRHQIEPVLAESIRGDKRLADLGVPASEMRHIQAALDRLLPQLTIESSPVDEARYSRTKNRRASDPDFLSRYFALAPAPGRISDKTLAQALASWHSGDIEGEASQAVLALVRPAPEDREGMQLAAQLIRRGEALADSQGEVGVEGLVTTLLSFLPLPRASITESPASALDAWLARLLASANDSGTRRAFARAIEAATDVYALVALLHALAAAVEEMRARSLQPTDPMELARLRRTGCRAALEAWFRSVHGGDQAPDEPVELLLSWVESNLPIHELDAEFDRRLAANPASGHLLARFVQTASTADARRRVDMPFDVTRALRRIGIRSLFARRAFLAQELAEIRTSSSPTNVWRERRALSISSILAIDEAERYDQLLPKLESREPGALTNYRPALLAPQGGDDPELLLQAHFIVPPTGDLSTGTPVTSELTTNAWESVAHSLISNSALDSWLRAVAGSWSGVVPTWQVVDSAHLASLRLHLQLDANPEGQGDRVQHPIRLGARVGVAEFRERGSSPTSCLVTFAVGMWFAELDAHRRPSQSRSPAFPAPAALSLTELYELIKAACGCADAVLSATPTLVGTGVPTESEEVLGYVTLDAAEGLSKVVDLSALTRQSNATQGQFSRAFVRRAALDIDGLQVIPQSDDIAVAIMSEWLLRDGYRNFYSALYSEWSGR